MKRLTGLEQFLAKNPRMAIVPRRGAITVINGQFDLLAHRGEVHASESYQLQIEISEAFPRAVPKVYETAQKIPRIGDFHVNGDGTLCLGSPLRLMANLLRTPTLEGFSRQCLVPYLFAVTVKLRDGGKFLTGELAHGAEGVVNDYMDLFGLDTASQVIYGLELLGQKKRIANKRPCPCSCGDRLGNCQTHEKLNQVRPVASRSWFKRHAEEVRSGRFSS